MLKYVLDSLEGLEPAHAAMYAEKDGKFYLQVEGIPEPEDTSGLKAKVDQLLAEKKSEAEKRKAAEEQAKQYAEEQARKNGDVEALERSWNEKHTQAMGERDAQMAQLHAQVHALTVGATSARLAGELAVQGSASVLQKIIEPRLSVEMREGKPTVVVLDATGRPSALTVEELRAEIMKDPALAPLIAGSRATGGGAGGSNGGGAAKTWDQMSGMERVELRRTNPAEHARLKAAAGK